MTYLLKLDMYFRDESYRILLNRKATFKELEISVKHYISKDIQFRMTEFHIKSTNKQEVIDLDHIFYVETLYLLYNDNYKTFTLINEDNFKILKELINYEFITLNDFSVVN